MIAIESNKPEDADREKESVASVTSQRVPENLAVATLLDEIASLLSKQGANQFRLRAYQSAGEMLRGRQEPIREVLDHEGIAGLVALPTIGRSIANLIEQYLRLGRIPLLDRLRGEDTAERIFATLPGLGAELSRRIHEELEIETLPELLAAVQDGRLEEIPGIGRKRVRAIGECLAARIRPSRSPKRLVAPSQTSVTKPIASDPMIPVSELLEIDAEYRRLAAADKLPKIAPRRFNPGRVAWLPVLHTQRGDRHYTALYSNTARAHQLNTTKDWVIIYRDDPQSDGRWTVITSQFGKLRGYRIIRGRENDCAEFYLRDR